MITRRSFVRNSGLLGLGSMLQIPRVNFRKKALLSFSTLACPDWTFDEIISFARENKYDGIELRGIKREIDLTKLPEFSVVNRKASLKKVSDSGLRIINLGSSSTLHFPPGDERDKQLQQGKQFIDLAYDLKCPFVRVYPNNFNKELGKAATMELIAQGLIDLGNYAGERNIKVLIETHGDLVWSEDIEQLMKMANHTHVGLVWDFCNMWTITKEKASVVYSRLKPYIFHTHIKDANLVNGKPSYVYLGKGEVPIFEMIEILQKDNYKGYYSFEWEKLWHPELSEPGPALQDYISSFRQHRF